MRRFIAVAVAVLALSAHAAIIAGPEIGVSAPAIGRAFGTHRVLGVASDGTNFLVAWQNNSPGAMTINLSLVGPDGAQLLVPSHSLGLAYANSVSIVWTGEAYLVFWPSSGGAGTNFARVEAGGAVTVEKSILNTTFEDVAWNGSHALVSYHALGVAARLALVDDRGAVVRDVALKQDFVGGVHLSAAGDRFIAVWAEFYSRKTRIVAASVDDDLNVNAQRVIVPEFTETLITIDLTGGSLAWLDHLGNLHRDVIDPATLALQTLPVIAISVQEVHLASGLVYWTIPRGQDQFLETLPFDGDAIRETRITSPQTADLQLVASNESLFAAWTNTSQQVNGALLDLSASIVKRTDFPVAISRVAQSAPAIASGGDVSLVVWLDLKDTLRGDLVAERVDSRGVAIDAQPFVIESDVPYWSPITAGFTGDVWLVAHARGDNTTRHDVVQRISRDGAAIEAAREVGVSISSFASNGTTSLFAGSAPNGGVRVVRFNRAGDLLDEVTVSAQPGFSVAVAAASDEFLVVWNTGTNFFPSPTTNLRDVVGARLDESGTPIDVVPIEITASPRDEGDAHVASDGRDFIVTYIDHVDSVVSGTLRARRVLHEGAAGDVTTIAENVIASSITGKPFFIVYRDANHLFATTLDRPAPLVIDDATINFRDPVAVSPTTALMGYSRTSDVARAFIRPLTIVTVPERGRGVRH